MDRKRLGEGGREVRMLQHWQQAALGCSLVLNISALNRGGRKRGGRGLL